MSETRQKIVQVNPVIMGEPTCQSRLGFQLLGDSFA